MNVDEVSIHTEELSTSHHEAVFLSQQSARIEEMSSITSDLKSRSIKHCRSCFRSDIHIPCAQPPILYGFLIVFTLGLILLYRPSRCVCCGTKRHF